VLRAWFTFLVGVCSGAPNGHDHEGQRNALHDLLRDLAGSDDALITLVAAHLNEA
jgi:hypothetical protein